MEEVASPTAPEDSLGLLVCADRIFARSEKAAVGLRSVVAYSSGINVEIKACIRGSLVGGAWLDPDSTANPATDLLLGLGYGSRPKLTPVMTLETAAGIGRFPQSLGWGDQSLTLAVWFSPLLAGRPLNIGLRWPSQRITEALIEIHLPANDVIGRASANMWEAPTSPWV